MHALWDGNQGISRAVEPLPGTTGSAEAAGLATKPDYCKRLLLPRPTLMPVLVPTSEGVGRRRGMIFGQIPRIGFRNPVVAFEPRLRGQLAAVMLPVHTR